MTVEELLDKIDDMIDKAWSIPLSGGKCTVDADELRDLLDQIRAYLPSEIRQAKAIVSDRTDIIDAAKRESEAIIRKAEERAQVLVSEEEIVKQSQQKAAELLNQSQQKSREIRRGAGDFAEDLLKRTEETLAARLSEVRQARQALRTPNRTDIADATSQDA